MNQKWETFQFTKEVNSILFNSEIENIIFEYCKTNKIIVPNDFTRNCYKFYQHMTVFGYEYIIFFLGRFITDDDILRLQIEFMIKRLEK